jgi:hypothetical protein
MGTILPSLPPPPNSPSHHASGFAEFKKFPTHRYPSARVTLGQLPKLHFPKLDSENPKLWQSRCESYFEMYAVEQPV